ncbi:M28 family peptidase [Myxococcota bacterium]|nr:M28 family peptidase [Myxococcota bacterium]
MPKAISDDHVYVDSLIRKIVSECPRRQPTSEDEHKALEIMAEELQAQGLEIERHHFKFNDNLYANLLLHAATATAGTAVSAVAPALGLVMHLGSALSYWADSTRRGYYLRRLFPFKDSFNVLATMKAKKKPALRVVMMGHADAAFTGWVFNPKVTKLTVTPGDKPLHFLQRSLSFMVATQFALAGIDAVKIVLGPFALPLRPLECLLTLPSALATVMNAQIVLKNEIVPGANDNLSACAALPVLAKRLRATQRDDVEYVFVVTGCEEASMGGADALGRVMKERWGWDPSDTVFVGLDGLGNGDLRFLQTEGEVCSISVPQWLIDTANELTASDPKYAEVTGFHVPVGGSDIAALLVKGYDGICLACVDPTTGAPRHYHMPTDDPDHLEMDKVMFSIEYAEKLVHAIVKRKLGL